jgi:hypothetical protein
MDPSVTYSDADHGGNSDNGKSTGGYLVKLGTGAVSWSSKLQTMVALSTTEAEYIAAVEAAKEIIWMRQFMGELGYPPLLLPPCSWTTSQQSLCPRTLNTMGG